jgi:hypothetical protein
MRLWCNRLAASVTAFTPGSHGRARKVDGQVLLPRGPQETGILPADLALLSQKAHQGPALNELLNDAEVDCVYHHVWKVNLATTDESNPTPKAISPNHTLPFFIHHSLSTSIRDHTLQPDNRFSRLTFNGG